MFKYIDGEYVQMTQEEIDGMNDNLAADIRAEKEIKQIQYNISHTKVTNGTEPNEVNVTDDSDHWKIILVKNKSQIQIDKGGLSVTVWQYDKFEFKKKKGDNETIQSVTTDVADDKDRYFEMAERPDDQYNRNRQKITELFEICYKLAEKVRLLEQSGS